MSILTTYKQHSSDDRIRTIRLTGLGTRTVASAVWTATPPGFTVGANTETDDTSSCLLGGGVSGTIYRIVAVITLDSAENVVGQFDIEVDDT
jgi:hypothetical protein